MDESAAAVAAREKASKDTFSSKMGEQLNMVLAPLGTIGSYLPEIISLSALHYVNNSLLTMTYTTRYSSPIIASVATSFVEGLTSFGMFGFWTSVNTQPIKDAAAKK